VETDSGREGVIPIHRKMPSWSLLRRKGVTRRLAELRIRLWLIVAVLGVFQASPAWAEETSALVMHNTYGEVGLLETPSGHMAPDGQIALTVGGVGQSQRYALSFQVVPWLEGSFRYSHVVGLHGGIDNNRYYDRSFGLKLRLVRESTNFPDISIGIRDLLGTGVYSAEYLVASKHIGPLDLTVGMGWGDLSQTGTLPNPLGQVFPAFKFRTSEPAANGVCRTSSSIFTAGISASSAERYGRPPSTA
jgi:hypothetical protein